MTDTAETTTLDAPVKTSAMGRDVVVANQGGAVMVAPHNLSQMIEFAQLMSRGGAMVGKPFREKPGACLGIATQAWRWGMDPYSCSQKAYVVSDAIGYEAQLVHAVILKNAPLTRRPKFEYLGSGPTRQCKVTFFAKDEPDPLEYLSPEFKDIKTKNSPLWLADTDQQLGYYSVRAAARRHFPDIIMGVYTPEEIRENPQMIGEAAGEIITLSGGGTDNIPEAEFSDGTIVLTKNAKAATKKKPAKEKGVSPVTASQENEISTGEAETEGGSSSVTPNNTAPDEAANEPEKEEQAESDVDIVARVSAEIRAAPAGSKSQPIREARGALTRIAQMSEDKKLAAKAEQILNLYDLD